VANRYFSGLPARGTHGFAACLDSREAWRVAAAWGDWVDVDVGQDDIWRGDLSSTIGILPADFG
jgi:hypothetical protein